MIQRNLLGLLLPLLMIGACSPDAVQLSDEWYASIPQGVEGGEPGQPVFVFFSAPWCRVCDRMKRDVLQEDAVIKALRPFTLVSVDIDKQPKTAESFQILAVPAFVVLDGEGSVRARSIGFTDADKLAQTLHAATPLLAAPENTSEDRDAARIDTSGQSNEG